MKIYLLTPIYATTTSMQGATPVVHYFTREWIKMGHEVSVFHFEAKYPRLMYWAGRLFQHKLNSRLGMLVPVVCPSDGDYDAEGVHVHRRCLKKLVPHSLYSKNRIAYALSCIDEFIEREGEPDWFIGHWDNPQLELLDALKKRYRKPSCLVVHDNEFNYESKYGERCFEMLNNLDVIGFRSPVAQRKFEKKYGKPFHSFIASSGVSGLFLSEGKARLYSAKQPIRNYVFVGSLIERKHPVAIVTALAKVYPEGNYSITYIGDGAEKDIINQEHKKHGGFGEVKFTGRIPREEIIGYLKQAEVFVMISEGEIFGLVYLEAMALGLIPVGSRNEGIDGVIKDGENGFLCEAGNADELANVLDRIKNLPLVELERLSNNAKETANEYSDEVVAKHYIENLKAI